MRIEPTEGEYIFYKALDGVLSLYKVEKVSNNPKAVKEFLLALANSDGSITDRSKRFRTTLIDKNGSPRLIRVWVQIGERVKLVNMGASTGKLGKVTGINPDTTNNAMIEVTTDDKGWHLLTLKQSTTNLQLVE